jgi:NAD(P)-dependent dehydrogenase (short-subunit alcohol dehydrogenase family)
MPPSELLKGRTAIVTGGTSGIGFEIAKAFVNAGATVIITSRSKEKAIEACKQINLQVKRKEQVYGIELNSTNVSLFKEKFSEIINLVANKSIDILVNNAGLRGGYISNASEQEYDIIMDTNVKGTFFLTQLFAKYMIKNGIKGNILNISSASSIRPAISAYHMSKWAIRGLTKGLARSLAPYGITVNAIAPGPTATPMLVDDYKNGSNVAHERNLVGRYALPEEIANMAVILVSDMYKIIIGDTVFMSGGGGIITNEDVDFTF